VGASSGEGGGVNASVSVIICAYTKERWELLEKAVASALDQRHAPMEIILCIDHNPSLVEDCRARFATPGSPIRVVENKYPGRLGSARNTAVEVARGDVIAFLDDDAAAGPDWLERLVELYSGEAEYMVIGGAPVPRYATRRPGWFPPEFDWVFGCAYSGLPLTRSPVRHVIGACMSARRDAITAVAGFHSDNHDDMDLCHRIAHRFGPGSVIYDPSIRVSHYVGEERVTWSYFRRRCYSVNRGKVRAFSDMKEAGNIRAEMQFALRSMFHDIPRYILSGRPSGVARAGVTFLGLVLGALGHLHGKIDLRLGRSAPSCTTGLDGAVDMDRTRVEGSRSLP
jgi:glycosyltransferase involved in cell wall biosynthesis